MEYLVVKWLHVISATLIFGTGLGSAFYMFMANRVGSVAAIATVVRLVVIADWVFTTPAIVAQPLTGVYLAQLASVPLSASWIVGTLALYLLAGACWLPVVWLQIQMRDLAHVAHANGQPLPPLYWRYERWWIALGVPAFSAMLAAFYLMVAKPM